MAELKMILGLFLITTLLLGTINVGCVRTDSVITSPAGTFRGKILTAHSGAEFEAYRGIPYALPPIGDRRFALPQPYPKIKDVVYDAYDFGPVCMQFVDGSSLGQEDCLYLNIYAPLNVKDSGVQLKKVLVFIHGGGFALGSSNVYVPGDLVAKGDVLVVTFNYRLGWLGFLRGDSKYLPGNQAFWDQLLALQWVKENILAFGGDANDVTLSGESAGSLSVSVLSISPLAKGLFSKAVLMSGAAFSFPSPLKTSTDLLEIVYAKTGCENETNHIKCLKKKPAENFQMEFNMAVLVNLPSSGDELLPRPILQLVNDPEYLMEVDFFNRDYIVSVTRQDGYIRINSLFGEIDTTSLEASTLGMSRLLKLPEHVTQALLLEYLKSNEEVEKAVIALNTDVFYLQRSIYFLETFAKCCPQAKQLPKNLAYFMSFDHAPKYFPNHYAVHALDLVYLFDLVPKDYLESIYFIKVEGDLTDKDLELKASFINMIANFMKTGNPSENLMKEKNIVWPPFDSVTKSYLSFSLHPLVHQDLYSDRRIIWEELVPQWNREYEQLQQKQEL